MNKKIDKALVTRSAIDRRAPMDRRVIDLGPRYPENEQRIGSERRQGWEDRYGWERTSRWSSAPLYPDIP